MESTQSSSSPSSTSLLTVRGIVYPASAARQNLHAGLHFRENEMSRAARIYNGKPLCLMHDPDEPVGEITTWLCPVHGNIMGKATVFDTPKGREAVRMIRAGELSGFSEGFDPSIDRTKDFSLVTQFIAREVSLVDKPGVPGAMLISYAEPGGETVYMDRELAMATGELERPPPPPAPPASVAMDVVPDKPTTSTPELAMTPEMWQLLAQLMSEKKMTLEEARVELAKTAELRKLEEEKVKLDMDLKNSTLEAFKVMEETKGFGDDTLVRDVSAYRAEVEGGDVNRAHAARLAATVCAANKRLREDTSAFQAAQETLKKENEAKLQQREAEHKAELERVEREAYARAQNELASSRVGGRPLAASSGSASLPAPKVGASAMPPQPPTRPSNVPSWVPSDYDPSKTPLGPRFTPQAVEEFLNRMEPKLLKSGTRVTAAAMRPTLAADDAAMAGTHPTTLRILASLPTPIPPPHASMRNHAAFHHLEPMLENTKGTPTVDLIRFGNWPELMLTDSEWDRIQSRNPQFSRNVPVSFHPYIPEPV